MKRIYFIVLSIVVLLSSCTSPEQPNDGSKENTNVPVTSVSLSRSSAELVEGESITLIATVSPNNATDKTVSWSSSKSSIASVDYNGTVKALSFGSVTITATAGGKSASCNVSVVTKTIKVESITLNKSEVTLVEGETFSLVATISPIDATDPSVAWSSSNSIVATVDNNGLITAIKEGTAIISASNGNVKATCSVSVSSGHLSIHNSKKGGLQEELSKYDLKSLRAMTISGVLNDIDFLYIKDNTSYLSRLDISDVDIEEIPIQFGSYHRDKPIDLILPKKLKTIKERQFNHSGVRSLSFGSDLEVINDAAFAYCSLLEEVSFAPQSQLREIKGPAVSDGPNGIGYLGDMYYQLHGAFCNCTALKSITLPASLEIIGMSSFQACSALEIVIFEKGSRLKKIEGQAAFSRGVSGIEPYASDFNGYSRGAFKGCVRLGIIALPSSLEEIGGSVFQNTAISELNWQDLSHLTTIGKLAFANSPLSSVVIPNSLETLGEGAFLNCIQLSSVSFNKGSKITELGAFCFGTNKVCSSLEQVILPASIITLDSAFSHREMSLCSFEPNSQLNKVYGLFYYGTIEMFDASNCKKVTSIGGYTWDNGTKVVKLGTKTPPSLSNNLDHVPILKVPSDAVDSYKKVKQWADTFDSISSLDD